MCTTAASRCPVCGQVPPRRARFEPRPPPTVSPQGSRPLPPRSLQCPHRAAAGPALAWLLAATLLSCTGPCSSNYSGRWAQKSQRGSVDFPETLQLRAHLLASPQLATREGRKVSKQRNSAVVSPSPLSPSRKTLCARSPGVSWCRFCAG